MREPLLIRADAGPRIGIGHIMRSLALAQAWQRRGGEVHLASSKLPPALADQLCSKGLHLHQVRAEPGSMADAEALSLLAEAAGASGAVIDGYVFSSRFSTRFRQGGLRLLWVNDDPAPPKGDAEQIVNPNLYMEEQKGQALPGEPEIFAGPRYALLRQEFCEPPPRIDHSGALRILVTLGGSDPTATTPVVVRALKRIESPLEVRVVIGPAQQPERLDTGSEDHSTVLNNVWDMATQMAWADLALAGAGVVCTELARCGVPTLAIVQAENQIPVAAAVDRLGLGWNLGWVHDEVSLANRIEALVQNQGLRATMSAVGPLLVDGHGAERVARAWDLGSLRLRPAQTTDAERLFVWANDPETRAMSFTSEAIPWDVHMAWLQHQLEESRNAFFIAEQLGGNCIGQVRFQPFEAGFLISVGLAPEARGKGWGRRIIAKACDRLPPGSSVSAYIKPENKPSIRVFAKAGFGPPRPAYWGEHKAVRMDFLQEGT